MKFSGILEEVVKRGNYNLQLHLSSDKRIDYTVNRSVRTTKHINKPEKGFWTSTAYKNDGKYTSKWWEFYKTTHFSYASYVHLMTIQGNPNRLKIGSEGRVKEVMSEYPVSNIHGRPSGSPSLNWTDISEDFDCVHVYGNALRESRFRTWDVESTVWFDPTYLKKQFTWKITNDD